MNTIDSKALMATLTLMKNTRRSALLVALTLVASVLVFGQRADATETFGGWGSVQLALTKCLWARASWRVPSNQPGANFDFNVYGYKEPGSSCDDAAPWQSVSVNELAIYASLWTQGGTFCSETSHLTIPSGTPTPLGLGRAYFRTGACSIGALTVKAYASPAIADWNTLRSQVTTS